MRWRRGFRPPGYLNPAYQHTEEGLNLEVSFGEATPVDRTSSNQTSILGVWGETNTSSLLFQCSHRNPRPSPPHCPVPPVSHHQQLLVPYSPEADHNHLTPQTPLHCFVQQPLPQIRHEGDKAFPKLNTERIRQSEFPRLTVPNGSFQREPFTKRKQFSR